MTDCLNEINPAGGFQSAHNGRCPNAATDPNVHLTTVTHHDWRPESGECGEGKFHFCSRPYFCDEFRQTKGDRYVAIEVKQKDLHAWKNPGCYPHKIGGREGKVLYECDRFGKKLE